MSRKKSRDLCFKIVFANLFTGNKDVSLENNCFDLDDYLVENNLKYEDVEFGVTLANKTLENRNELLVQLQEKIEGYTINRVHKPELAILMIAVCELNYFKDTNFKIVINEAVELSKTYCDDNSYKFVHGILSKFVVNNKGEC